MFVSVLYQQKIKNLLLDNKELNKVQAQYYMFVRALVGFVASVLVKAWKESEESCDVELSDVVPRLTNQEYCRFLESLMSLDVEYTVTSFWAMEAVHNTAFPLPRKWFQSSIRSKGGLSKMGQ